MIPNEVKTIISIIDEGMIWIYIGVFFAIVYLLISLLTWSIIKPLKYLGIPTLIVGLSLIIIRFISNSVLSFFNIQINLIDILLPSLLKPILLSGISCLLIGILMIISYTIINNQKVNKEENLRLETL